MIITEIQYFFSKIIRFQAIFKDTVEFTCALEFKISSQPGMQNGEPFCIAPGSPSFLLFAAETCALCLAAGTGVAPCDADMVRAAFLILVKRAVAGLTCHIDCL